MALRALFVDFNSYFSSVEQQEQPELRGRPVVVTPVMTDSTCCIAASYEAKKFGIKTGTNVGEARKLCPGLIVVEARPPLYVDYHHRLIEAVDSCVPVTSIRSIDEMYCLLHGRWRERETAVALAHQIKARIAAMVGTEMRSSIGLAPNPYLAKTASDMQKPDGLVVIEQEELPQKLFSLELRDLYGIGSMREKRLHACGLHTVRELCLAPKETLRRAWNGIEGDRMYALLRGEEVDRPPSDRCTVGHSQVLEPKCRTRLLAEATLHRLLQKAAARLRALGYLAAGLSVSVKFFGDRGWGREMHFLETQDTLELIRIFGLVWKEYPSEAPTPLKVGVTLFHLTAVPNSTRHLPQMEPSRPSRPALDQAVDRLNLAFGRHSVYFGGAQPGVAVGPSKIAFTSIPEREVERKVYPARPAKRVTRKGRLAQSRDRS
jgi:DNA polymerase-4